MRTPQRSFRLAKPCAPLTDVKNAWFLYAAYPKGGSFPSKANSQVQDLRVATIDIHLVFHHILSGKYLWLRLGVFFLQIWLEIKFEVWYNRRAIPPKALADKTAGVFFYFFAD